MGKQEIVFGDGYSFFSSGYIYALSDTGDESWKVTTGGHNMRQAMAAALFV